MGKQIKVDFDFIMKIANQIDILNEKLDKLEKEKTQGKVLANVVLNETPVSTTTFPNYIISFEKKNADLIELQKLYESFFDDFKKFLAKYPDLKRFMCHILK